MSGALVLHARRHASSTGGGDVSGPGSPYAPQPGSTTPNGLARVSAGSMGNESDGDLDALKDDEYAAQEQEHM
jgi:hypothetical protein